MEIAGDRPPRYGEKTVLEPSRGTGPRATIKKTVLEPSRGTGPRATVKKTVLEPSRGTGPRATGKSRPGGLSYRHAGGCHRDVEQFMKHPQTKCLSRFFLDIARRIG